MLSDRDLYAYIYKEPFLPMLCVCPSVRLAITPCASHRLTVCFTANKGTSWKCAMELKSPRSTLRGRTRLYTGYEYHRCELDLAPSVCFVQMRRALFQSGERVVPYRYKTAQDCRYRRGIAHVLSTVILARSCRIAFFTTKLLCESTGHQLYF
jgi:hypothetical protein